MFRGLDHLAIVVPDTEAALIIWRDRCGFPVLFSEKVNGDTVLLTHLDLGNTHLQLVQPLIADHPLWHWLETHGPGLHHFCMTVDDVGQALVDLPPLALPPGEPTPHQGTQGKRALFLDLAATAGVQVELTGA
ncbi:MAG: VOC family protein [Herpetosiphonaceae bacterium]|nr:VOC family protein [Herpetosiphonaceae bacterium]